MNFLEYILTILKGSARGGYVDRGDRKLPDTNLPATRKASDDELFGDKGKQAPDSFKEKVRGQAEQVRKQTAAGGFGLNMWEAVKDDLFHKWPWFVIGVMILLGLSGVLREAPKVVVQLGKSKGR